MSGRAVAVVRGSGVEMWLPAFFPRVTMDVEAVVQLVSRGLRDPARPSVCVRCLGLSFDPLFSNADAARANVRVLRRDHHAFLTAAMEFVTAPRTEQDMLELQRSLRTAAQRCARGHNNNALPLLPGDGIVDHLICELSRIASVCMENSQRLVETQRFSGTGLARPRTYSHTARTRPSPCMLPGWAERSGTPRRSCLGESQDPLSTSCPLAARSSCPSSC